MQLCYIRHFPSWSDKTQCHDLRSADEVSDCLRDAVVPGEGVVLAAFVQQLDKLGGEPAPQAVQLPHPAVLVLH